METVANVISYGLTFAISSIFGVAFSDTPLMLLGLLVSISAASTVAFVGTPEKYYFLATSTGYLTGFICTVIFRKRENKN